MSLYHRVARPVLFRADAEWCHDRVIQAAERASAAGWLCERIAARRHFRDERLVMEVAGLRFDNPIGLAAGFDKSGRGVPLWAALGFGHVEVGSISAEASCGNPKPRLFRIPADRGIVVNYGLPNDGAARIASRLTGLRLKVPLGLNLVNTNRGPSAPRETDDSVIEDYVISLKTLENCGDYFVLNLSCPNTQDGRAFVSDSCRLNRLLRTVEAIKPAKPVFLKVAPFAGLAELERFLEAAHGVSFVSGFAVNLPPGKPAGLTTPAESIAKMPGAVSGKPCEEQANFTIREIFRRMDRRRYFIIGAGGVFTGEDAYRKMRLGASLVQLLTALIYEGPGVVRTVCEDLARLAARDGVRNCSEVVGADVAP